MPTPCRMTVALAALACALLLALPGAGRAGTPAEDLAWLNAKRAASGIPGDVVESPAWSAACAQHLAYMRRTDQVTHAEDPASPYYSETGNWAGTHAVLASTTTWTATNFIWETAPLHLAQLLAPELSQVGIADDGQFVCVTTWPGYLRPPPPTDSIVAYPGPDVGIYASETAEELPTTPGAALGLGTPTGPHIYAYLWGPSASSGVDAAGAPLGVSAATLDGREGRIAVRWVDQRNASIGRYLPAGAAIIIPVAPLRDEATYVVTVTFTNGVQRAWSFTTTAVQSLHVVRDVRFAVERTGRRRMCIRRDSTGCARWALRYTGLLRIRGRVLLRRAPGGGSRGLGVIIGIDRVDQPVASTGRDGRFAQTAILVQRRARETLLITVRADESGTSAYLLRVQLGPGRRSLLQVEPVSRAMATGPPPRSAAQAFATT